MGPGSPGPDAGAPILLLDEFDSVNERPYAASPITNLHGSAPLRVQISILLC